jgi:hypothetical protein
MFIEPLNISETTPEQKKEVEVECVVHFIFVIDGCGFTVRKTFTGS